MVAVIHPSPRLCPRCTSFPWPSNPDYNEPMFQDLTLSDTFYCLQNSADRGFVLRLFICNGQLLLTPIIKHEGELVLRSAGPNGDFHSESPRMGDYYSHAACCISASAANDSSEGILTERPIARFPMDDIALRLASHQTDELRYHLFKANDYNPSLKHSLLMSPITKRGWCLQETALPKRILHWTAQGLYLECQSSLFLEGRKTPLEDSPFSKADSSPRVVMRMPDKDILFYNGWYQLVAQFSNTQLTYETDRLYAIHGLASILIQRLKAEYFNGLFRTSLAEGLLWYHSNLEHESYKRPINAQLPSWCWASSCPVRFMRIDQTPVFITDDHPERPLQFPTHSEALNMVESTAPRLYIRAPVIQLLIGRNNKAFVKDKVSGHTEPCSCTYFLDRNRRVMQSMPYTPAVNGEWEQDQSVSVLWLPVGQAVRYFNSPIVGLLVHELPEEGKGVYRRYGVLEYYKMQDQENRSFRDVEDIILI
ncbi:uncharacterized protein FOBCDRAFT_138426 [Fusarium oxysporum Fo47]|uniref:uncharacterized protein n=1 Tax=Fusarium oxysporum Fo47 TaxID=660027 RepID=UPI002869BC88|nr:uncharacterized protein FOBCDRAFT_138426 [Fusarium oxysporum Fo47]QKD55452.2 hypothetical protein FOBCDRAFT_138426 [Fusarium oxysporum Fo47]